MASKGRDLGNIVSPKTGIAVTFSGDPVVLGVGNTQHVRVTGSGLVGIGMTNPAGVLNVQTNTAAGPSLTYNSANILNLDYGTIQLAAGIDPSSPFGSYLQSRDNTNGSRTLNLNPAGGNVGIGTDNPLSKLHVAGGNIKVDSGYGIDFSATSNGTGANQSELLDDFEEGTWTPKFVNITNGNDYFVNNGLTIYHANYVKIGEHCWASAYIANDASFSYATGIDGSQHIGIGGLPFTVIGSNGGFYPISVGYFASWTGWGASYTPMGYFYSGFDRVVLTYATTNTITNIQGSVMLNGGSGLLFSGYYKVA